MTMYCSYLISLLSNQDKIESSLSMATAIYQDAGYSTSLLPEYSFLILFACARYFITALKISCLNFLSPCPIRTSIIQVLSFLISLTSSLCLVARKMSSYILSRAASYTPQSNRKCVFHLACQANVTNPLLGGFLLPTSCFSPQTVRSTP